MKFTDLNFDCLEIVLEYLNLIDFLNVTDTSKRLNKAAELVFARMEMKMLRLAIHEFYDIDHSK